MKKLLTLLTILLASFIMSACGTAEDIQNDTTDIIPPVVTAPEEISEEIKSIISFKADPSSFATWKEDKISYKPSVKPYTVNIPKDDNKSGTVEISDNYYLPPEVVEILNTNGFAITGDDYRNEYFEIYEENRYAIVPNFITTDSALHTYHLFFNYLLKSIEEEELFHAVVDMTDSLLAETRKQNEQLKGTKFEDASVRNLAYISVAKKILDPDWEIPIIVKEIVESEIKFINAHQGISNSNILGTDKNPYKEDYSQYIPRGHYTKSEKLKKYFNTLMWYGRITFRLNEIEETKSALLMVSALQSNTEVYNSWETLFEPINFFVGEPDDPSYYEYEHIAKTIFGEKFTISRLLENSSNLEDFIVAAKLLPDPKINSMPIFVNEDRLEAVEGFRLLGQRFTVDAMIFQKLIYRDVEANEDGENRMLPMALDIPAVFGSDEAFNLVQDAGATNYANYSENFTAMKDYIQDLPDETWQKNLYWGWMGTLKTLTRKYGEGYPQFMNSTNWKLKELVTFLGSFTELKHDTILYAKQVYAELGGGPEYEEVDDRGYVEPNPELYNKLKALVRLTIDGLNDRDLLNSKNKEQLEKLEEMMKTLRNISIKELEEKSLTEDEYEFIRNFGGSLEHFWYETLSDEEKNKGQTELLNGHPTSIIADIATDPNGYVLEEATGPVNKIYVVYPMDDKLMIGIGGVFSHYEFAWPMDDRLTDEKWRQILFPYSMPPYERVIDFIPKIADWQKSFTLEPTAY